MNPCPVHDTRTGTVFLFFVAVRGRTPEATQIAAGRNAARLCCVTSQDSGRSWGAARDLTAEAVGGAERGRWAQGVSAGGRVGEGLTGSPWAARPAPLPTPSLRDKIQTTFVGGLIPEPLSLLKGCWSHPARPAAGAGSSTCLSCLLI